MSMKHLAWLQDTTFSYFKLLMYLLNPVSGIIAVMIVLYANESGRTFNVFAINWYEEIEFWLALSKMIIITGLIIYTFITMLVGNPLHDRFGFRFWRDPGSFAECDKPGSLGRFLGF